MDGKDQLWTKTLVDVLIYLKLVIFSHVNQILQNAKFDAFFAPKKSAILIKNVREQCLHARDFFHVWCRVASESGGVASHKKLSTE